MLVQKLIELKQQGIHIALNGDKLKVKATSRTLNEDEKSFIGGNKEEIVALLAEQLKIESNFQLGVLSDTQRRLCFIKDFDATNTSYHIPVSIELKGAVCANLIEQTLQEVIQRHQILRTIYFKDEDEVYYQAVQSDFNFALTQCMYDRDVDQVSSFEKQSFDLKTDLMLRAQLIKVSEQHSILTIVMHHIAADGWSLGVLFEEFSRIYGAKVTAQPAALEPLNIQYLDYAQWQQTHLQGEQFEASMDYWRTQLASLPQLHSLPLDHVRPAQQSFIGKTYNSSVPAQAVHELKQMCQRHGATLFMGVNAVLAALLFRYSGEADVVVGTPVANRDRNEFASLIGFFSNTLVLRTQVEGELGFKDLLAQSKDNLQAAYRHQAMPFERLVEILQPERNTSYSPLFQIMLSMHNQDSGPITLAGLEVSPYQNDYEVAKFDISLNVVEEGEELQLHWVYNKDLFNEQTMVRLSDAFNRLLHEMVMQPDTAVEKIVLNNEPVKAQLEAASNVTLHDLFVRQVALTPEAVAVVHDDQSLTFEQLDLRAQQLAQRLHQQGVKAGDFIGICLPRTLEMSVAAWAVLKVGGVFVPMDPEHPLSRLQYQITDANIKHLIATQGVRDTLESSIENVIALDDPHTIRLLAEMSCDATFSHVSADSSAYVIYTSGTTGTPKGVLVSHRAICHFHRGFQAQLASLGIDKLNSWLWMASFTFDASLKGLLAQCLGAKVVVLDKETLVEPSKLVAQAVQHEIQIINTTPSLLEEILPQLEQLAHSRMSIITGGEALSQSLCSRIADYCEQRGTRAINAYGPTETTINATYGVIGKNKPLTIGSALPGYWAGILDKAGNPLPNGFPGELCIAGPALADGYLGKPELTEAVFQSYPCFMDGQVKVYRTGDKVRCLADGQFEYLGRLDEQVKIRGIRMELGEITSNLSKLPTVKSAHVVVVDKQREKYLAAYVQLVDNADTTSFELQAQLKAFLPAYMIPNQYMFVEHFPVTTSGKIDLKQLPKFELQQGEYVEPKTEIEKTLSKIWQQILKKERVGTSDNFFDLGGHSLTVAKVVAAIRRELEVDIEIKALFDNQDIASLAKLIAAMDKAQVVAPMQPVDENTRVELSFAQQRLWFIDQLDGSKEQYNMAYCLKLTGPLNIVALEKSIAQIMQRHQILRTSITADEHAVPYLALKSVPEQVLPIEDLSAITADMQTDELQQKVHSEATQAFDLSNDPMLRARLFKLDVQTHFLSLTMHHIASDGWSIGVLANELSTCYQAFCVGAEPQLPQLALQYRDYAHWQRQTLGAGKIQAQLDYWTDKLDGLPEVHGLNLDFPRAARQTFVGASCTKRLPAELSQRLKQYCKQHGATLFMGLHSTLAVLLARYSGENDIVIGTPIANRDQHELANLIGFFVNTLVLRADLSDGPNFDELIAQSRKTALDAFDNQQVPFDWLVERLKPERSLSHSPLFQVMLSLQNNDTTELDLSGLSVQSYGADKEIAKFDLTVNVAEKGDELELHWLYNRDLFEASSISGMADHFNVLLDSLLSNPQQSVIQAPLITQQDQLALVHAQEQGVVERGPWRAWHTRFEYLASTHPDNHALVYEECKLTYAQLNDKANKLAHYLKEKGCTRGQLVGVCLGRSLDMVIAMLAILKAGGAYVPLDPNYPVQRLELMIEDSHLELIVTSSEFFDKCGSAGGVQICVDDVSTASAIAQQPACNLEDVTSTMCESDPAYVIYTSGSTGRPKGALIMHSNLVHLEHIVKDMCGDLFALGNHVGWNASFSFDASVMMFAQLAYGVTLHILPEELRTDPDSLLNYIEKHNLMLLDATPRQLESIMHVTPADFVLPNLIIGGEEIGAHQWQQLIDRVVSKERSAFNIYGPTECTVFATYASIQPKTRSSIGKPVSNVQCYVLDSNKNLLPHGVPGELFIGGEGVCAGYLNRAQLNEEKFVTITLGGSTKRLYATGDKVRMSESGDLDFLGRIDQQVKIRGFRIEPGEIEQCLLTHPNVAATAVVANSFGGDLKLVAFVVKEYEQSNLADELKQMLSQTLPSHFVPSSIELLEALPMTPNRKVDRQALAAHKLTYESDVQQCAAKNELENSLLKIWQQLIGHQEISVLSDFFDIGGHSLLITRLANAIRTEFDIKLSISELFESRTIRLQAELLQQQLDSYEAEEFEELVL